MAVLTKTNYNMDTRELTPIEKILKMDLVKKEHFELFPYGHFTIKFKTRQANKPRIIPLDELRVKHNTIMPFTKQQEKEIIKVMKKNKTDILCDHGAYKFFTRMNCYNSESNAGLVEVSHKKLDMYRDDIAFKIAVDDNA